MKYLLRQFFNAPMRVYALIICFFLLALILIYSSYRSVSIISSRLGETTLHFQKLQIDLNRTEILYEDWINIRSSFSDEKLLHHLADTEDFLGTIDETLKQTAALDLFGEQDGVNKRFGAIKGDIRLLHESIKSQITDSWDEAEYVMPLSFLKQRLSIIREDANEVELVVKRVLTGELKKFFYSSIILSVFCVVLVLMALGGYYLYQNLKSQSLRAVTRANNALQQQFSQRSRAEEALRSNERTFHYLIESFPDTAIQGYDEMRTVIYWNSASEKLYGYTQEEAMGRKLEDLIIPAPMRESIVESIQNWIDHDIPIPAGELQLRGKNDRVVEIHSSHALIETATGSKTLFCLDLDLSEKKRFEREQQLLQSRLQHAQKMETIGTLAGGIAHDFNNLLTPIMIYADLVSRKLPENTGIQSDLDKIIESSIRARELVAQILSFSGEQEIARKNLSPQRIMKDAVKLLRAPIPKTVRFEEEMESFPETILADATQMHQVLMNLVTNSYQSMGGAPGTIKLSLVRKVVTGEEKTPIIPGKPGIYAVFSVVDTGCGMDAGVKDRAFDPFFTTKEKGKGTGLGLSVVHGIVTAHGGEVQIESEPGRGTSISIFIPLQTVGCEVPRDSEKAPVQTGDERICFVDDDIEIKALGERILGELGYHVVSFESSLEALEYFRKHPDDFDLVITDQVMPDMTGLNLIREVHHIRPDLPAILTTGFSESETEQEEALEEVPIIIKKPFSIIEFSNAVRLILDK